MDDSNAAGPSITTELEALRREVEGLRALASGDREALARKVGEVEAFARRAARIERITAALTTAATAHDVADAVTSHGTELFGASATLLFLLSRDEQHLELVTFGGAGTPRVSPYQHLSIDDDQPLPRAVRTGVPVWLGSHEEILRDRPELAGVRRDGARLEGIVALPLRGTHRILGGLACSFYEPPVLDEVQRSFFLTVASQCGLALERARLLENERATNRRLERQKERLAVLVQASEVLSASLHSRHALAELTKMVVPKLADWCAIDELTEGGAVRRLAVAHRHPDKVDLIRRLEEEFPARPDPTRGVPFVLRTGEREFVPEIPDALLTASAQSPEHLSLLRSLGLTSYAVVPIRARGVVLGALTLVSDGERRLFEDDVEFAEELARRAALALENARLYEAAEAARAQLHGLFTGAPAAISITRGPEHRYELANEPYERFVGERALVGKTVHEALPPGRRERIATRMAEVLETGRRHADAELPIHVEGEGGADAATRVYSVVRQPTHDAAGLVDGVATFAFEITEQVEARQRVERLAADNARLYADAQRLIKALEATNRELDQFAYVTSHDLKAPLRGIGSLAEWIVEDAGATMPPDAHHKMGLLRGRVRRMEALIQGILDYSRAARGAGKREEVDVGKLVADVAEMLGVKAPAAVTHDGALPVLTTERVAFQQVLLNLVGNALKHARKADAHVRVEARDAGDAWELRVIDDGPGIAAAFHERIWGIFQTLEARDAMESTGIGLSIVKKVVEARHGRVWVESSEGEGATFAFTWPKTEERER
jgi:signal transduction histidine kinase/GAF domain-containing protein